VIGYAECVTKPSEAYEESALLNRWVILGEHSIYVDNYIERALEKARKYNYIEQAEYDILEDLLMPTPVWMRRWGSIRKDLRENPNHCLILFERLFSMSHHKDSHNRISNTHRLDSTVLCVAEEK